MWHGCSNHFLAVWPSVLTWCAPQLYVCMCSLQVLSTTLFAQQVDIHLLCVLAFIYQDVSDSLYDMLHTQAICCSTVSAWYNGVATQYSSISTTPFGIFNHQAVSTDAGSLLQGCWHCLLDLAAKPHTLLGPPWLQFKTSFEVSFCRVLHDVYTAVHL